VQILSFTASATSVPANMPVTLSWTTVNASTVVLIGGPISTTVAPNGSLVITTSAAAVYTLTAYGSGGQTGERQRPGGCQVTQPGRVSSGIYPAPTFTRFSGRSGASPLAKRLSSSR
jgi:hypothetical protein